MQGDDIARSRNGRKLAGDGLPLLLKFLDAPGQRRRIDAGFNDGVDRPIKFAADLSRPPIKFRALVAGAPRQPLAFLVIHGDVFGEARRMRQFPAQPVERQPLNVVALDAPAVAANATLPKIGALQSGGAEPLALGNHPAAARAASDKPGQNARDLGASHVFRCAGGLLAALRGLPNVLCDDPQMRSLDDTILLFRVWPRHALAGRRVFNHPNFVPDDPPGIDFIEQDAGAALQIAVDRRGVPIVAARRLDPLRVQIARDVARRFAIYIVGEDSPDDFGLGLDDLQLAGLARDRSIAKSSAAGVAAVTDNTVHSAPDMQDEVFDKHFAHQGAQRAVELADLAAGGVNSNAEEINALARGVVVGLIAKDAIHILGDDYIE